MPRLPRVTSRRIIAVLEKIGFRQVRQSGSHKIYRNPVGRRVTIPFHGARTLHPKVLQSILRDADLDVETLIKLLR